MYLGRKQKDYCALSVKRKEKEIHFLTLVYSNLVFLDLGNTKRDCQSQHIKLDDWYSQWVFGVLLLCPLKIKNKTKNNCRS